MDITISHPEFKTQLLEMRISGYFSSPRILLNGVLVKRVDGEYALLNDAGNEVSVKLHTSPFNMLPQMLIEDEEIRIRTDGGWTQFAGWKKLFAVLWDHPAAKSLLKANRVKKFNKTVQG